jgi:hypothetical protein
MDINKNYILEKLERVLPPIFSREEVARLTGGIIPASSLQVGAHYIVFQPQDLPPPQVLYTNLSNLIYKNLGLLLPI